ncbi:Os07g0543800 [Oryza sativa Japonica Group]|jgi:hypothetical protein|uniref:Os07g0543800 protein n=2 Tax=Oryza sativa subsp. japonica TaxID=39947 RepID=A0A0P0X7D3_ORYSJ|nr:Os07g0543800 [Oryza sativa Japonica Group]
MPFMDGWPDMLAPRPLTPAARALLFAVAAEPLQPATWQLLAVVATASSLAGPPSPATLIAARVCGLHTNGAAIETTEAAGDGEADAAAVDRTARHALGIEHWTTVAEFTQSADLTTTAALAKGTRGR